MAVYKPAGPFQVRYWTTLDGQDPNTSHGWSSVDPGGDLSNLEDVRRRVRAMAKNPDTAPGIYVIVAASDVPCAGFEALDQVARVKEEWPHDPDTGRGPGFRIVERPDLPPTRFVSGSNLGWAR